MPKRLRFALNYAVRNMIRDRQRTIFALFSIAAGVATVVALRMLGLMLTDALTSNAQAFLRGDLRVQTSSSAKALSISAMGGNGSAAPPFTPEIIKWIDDWAAQNNIEVTYMNTSELTQAAVVREGRAGRPAFALSYFIDPQHYPFYDVIRAEQPSRVPLAQLFTGSHQVVVGRRLANELKVNVGETIRLGTADQLYTVTGIVPDTSESNFDNPFSIMFSFIYLDRAYARDFGLQPDTADRAYLKIPPSLTQKAIADRIWNEWPRPSSGQGFGGRIPWLIRSAESVMRDNAVVADLIGRFVLLLSLVALVIGGVGIINTMLVSVNRRSAEIAVLKTLGLKGRGVTLIFLVEAVLLGILGSFIGLGLGLLLSLFARSAGEQTFAVALPWRLHLDPLLLGMALGVSITIFFSLLPTLMAGQVRPSLVLRQGNIPLARAGCLPTLLSLAVLIVGLGLIVELIVNKPVEGINASPAMVALRLRSPIPIGVVGTFAVLVVLGIIIALMWLLVWLLGRLPSFRNPNLRIAIRGLTMHRSRTALSLLALIVGMTALSGTLIMTRSIQILLSTSITEPLGGNMIILPLVPLTDVIVRSTLDSVASVKGYREFHFPGTQLVAINGDRGFRRRLTAGDDPQLDLLAAQLDLILGVTIHGSPPRGKLVAGRYLTAQDQGQRRIVIPYNPVLEEEGVKVGSTFTYRLQGMGFSSKELTFEVVGIVAPDERAGMIPFSLSDGAVQAPLDVIPSNVPFNLMIASVDNAAIDDAMAAVGAIPGVLVFDITFFDSIISRLMNQMAAIPLLVAGLSLFAAGALIAGTVSLATMERRRQIGILKAVGVKRRQALGQLLIENGIIGLVGGIISLAPTILILVAIPALTQNLVSMPVPADLIALMMALSIAITLLATLLTAWSASGERPLAVLRYE